MTYAIEVLREKLIDSKSAHQTCLSLIERHEVYREIATEYALRVKQLEKALEVLEREKEK